MKSLRLVLVSSEDLTVDSNLMSTLMLVLFSYENFTVALSFSKDLTAGLVS